MNTKILLSVVTILLLMGCGSGSSSEGNTSPTENTTTQTEEGTTSTESNTSSNENETPSTDNSAVQTEDGTTSIESNTTLNENVIPSAESDTTEDETASTESNTGSNEDETPSSENSAVQTEDGTTSTESNTSSNENETPSTENSAVQTEDGTTSTESNTSSNEDVTPSTDNNTTSNGNETSSTESNATSSENETSSTENNTTSNESNTTSTEDNVSSEVINTNPTDITNAILTNKSANCADFVKKYASNVTDIQNDTDFQGSLEIKVLNGKCLFSSNIIPNHDFNDVTARFADVVQEQDLNLQITTAPSFSNSTTPLYMSDLAIFLNGVTLDVLSAGCYGVGNGSIGCHDLSQPFRYEPLGTENKFGADAHNAHTQPGGKYHYHGSPLAMYDDTGSVESAVIGFAADGFPIFGPYFNDNGTIRKATSSYTLKVGTRAAVMHNGTNYNPGGTYDGTYIDDWEYLAGSGDLDECNGMTLNGVYGYYITETYPYVIGCFKGTVDTSFSTK